MRIAPRSSFFWIVIIVIINYFIGKSKPQLLSRHANYILSVNRTIDKILQLLDFNRQAVLVVLKSRLFSHQLLILQNTRGKCRQRCHKQ